jgi:hypothetical protein
VQVQANPFQHPTTCQDVKISISEMEQLVERYSSSGKLKGSLKKELLQALKDARDNFRDGDLKDAIGCDEGLPETNLIRERK